MYQGQRVSNRKEEERDRREGRPMSRGEVKLLAIGAGPSNFGRPVALEEIVPDLAANSQIPPTSSRSASSSRTTCPAQPPQAPNRSGHLHLIPLALEATVEATPIGIGEEGRDT
jgi:hypothetical protein